MLALAGRMSAEDHRAETVYSTSAGGVNAFVLAGGIVGGALLGGAGGVELDDDGQRALCARARHVPGRAAGRLSETAAALHSRRPRTKLRA